MKRRLMLMMVLIAGLAAGVGNSALADDQVKGPNPDMPVARTAAQSDSAFLVMGVIKASEDGLYLESRDATYQLKGFENIKGLEETTLKNMVGKLAKVSGDLGKDSSGMSINVKEIAIVN
jgi:hypothetical protein